MAKKYRQFCEICGEYYEGYSAHYCGWACKLSLKATQNRLLEKIIYEEDFCWTSQFVNRSIKFDGKYHSIFKVAYSLKNEVDFNDSEIAYVHLCDNQMCVNPNHLTPTLEKNRNKYIFIADKERFWDNVDKKSKDECWEWKASRKKERKKGIGNYGKFSVKGKSVIAHRYSYMLHFGEIPEDCVICHLCDNPPCVNPNHLYAGTVQDNVLDKLHKNRGNFKIKFDDNFIELLRKELGEKEKQTNDRLRDEKGRFASNEKTYREVGEKYNLTPSQVWQLINKPRKFRWTKNENMGVRKDV